MKKRNKKVLSLLLAVIMLIGCFTACGEGGDETGSGATNASGEIDTAAQITEKPVINEPVTLSILTQRHAASTTDVSELWFFKYMEYWFAQQGYDVTINVQQTNEASQEKALLLGTDTMLDIVWGITLGKTNAALYGEEEEMLLNWAPYLNESLMPNLCKWLETYPDIRPNITAPGGGIYALPYIAPSQYASGCYGTSERLYYRQSWLDACGVKNPTTEEEFYQTLRAFKNMKLDGGREPIPVVSAGSFLEKYIWTCLGFYGTEPNKYGSNLMIKDGELVIPAYTESYRDFIKVMSTLYGEGLVAKDYFSVSDTTAGGLMRDGTCGALAWWTLEYVGEDSASFSDIVCANPIKFGDTKEIHVSRLQYYNADTLWVSSKTKYPELVAMMLDYIYSEEGAMFYRYGPKQGEDPLGLVDGWYTDENGDITTKLVEDGTYASMSAYGRDRIFPFDNAGLRPAVVTSGTGNMIEFTDSVTGEKYECIDNYKLDDNTNDGHWRLITIEKWSDYATSVRLDGAYLSSEDATYVSDIITTIQNYITKESAKFITGQRDISTIGQFWTELENLGIQEYLDVMKEYYAGYMDSVFKK